LAISEGVPFLAHTVDEAWTFDPSCVHATAGDRRAGTRTVVSGEMDAWNGAGGALCPQAAGEAVTDDFLGPPHDAHADHERDGGSQKSLYEDRTPAERRQLRKPVEGGPHPADEVVSEVGAARHGAADISGLRLLAARA
jgi:hypothetical protein